MAFGKKKKTIAKAPPKKKKTAVARPMRRPQKPVVVPKNQESKGYAPGLLGGIGSTVGSFFGGGPGGSLGKMAGDWLGKITGMGAYTVNSNSLMTDAGPPVFSSKAGSTRLRHREFISDISGSTAFTVNSLILNPGATNTFPWLSQIAQNFETYRLHGMVFEFKSTSADALNSTNTALGTFVMATSYDVLDAIFVNKQQMEAYEFSCSTRPSASAVHPIECDPAQNVLKELYIFPGIQGPTTGAGANIVQSLPPSADPRFYNVGNFCYATVGMQATSVIGELWVSYDVELFKPKLPLPGTSTPYFELIQTAPTRQFLFNGGTSAGQAGSGNNLFMIVISGNVISGGWETILQFPLQGTYVVTTEIVGSAIVTTTGLQASSNTILSNSSVVVSAAGTSSLTTSTIVVTANGGSAVFPSPTTLTAGTQASLRVVFIPDVATFF